MYRTSVPCCKLMLKTQICVNHFQIRYAFLFTECLCVVKELLLFSLRAVHYIVNLT